MRCLSAITATLLVVAGTRPASGEPSESPVAPRILNVPTADLQGAGRTFMTAGLSHKGRPFIGLSLGLGDIAEVDLEIADRVAICRACSVEERHAEGLELATALFKIGIAEGQFLDWQPGLALGFRASIRDRGVSEESFSAEVEAAQLYLVVSKTVGPVRLHGGAEVWDGSAVGEAETRLLHDQPLGSRVSPLAGLAWRPSIYPRTTLLADISYAAVFDRSTIELRWLGGWGVRYQAVSWGSIELAMRHRGGDSLSDSIVMVRINGSFASPFR